MQPDHPLEFAPAAAVAVGVVLFAVTAIGFALRGPLRWVKIATLLLLLDFLALACFFVGWESAVRFVCITVGSVFAATAIALLSWRHPVSKVLGPASFGDCPAHARKTVDRWSRELEAMGFHLESERRSVWKLHGTQRLSFVRFFTHPGEPLWMEIHALDSPKIVARMAVSDKGEGRALMTCDKQADQELFDDALTAVQRVASRASCAELVDAHRKLALTTEGSVVRREDPVRAHVELYGRWVERLLASGQVRRVDPSWIALARLRIPALILKTYAAWFH